MINLIPTATDALAESATELTNGLSHNIPIIGNAALCTDSLCTTGRAGLNFYCSPNLVSKVFFATSCVCGLIGAGSSGIAILSPVTGIPVLGWVGTFGARGFNRLGKYSLYMGNVTNGNITNATEIANLMS
jgi:hypothetical protein